MSDTKGSTLCAEDVLQRFHSNPVDFVVELDDGTLGQVREFRDTPKERWYRLRRKGGPWVPDRAVVGVMVYTVSLTPEAAATVPRRATA